MSQILSSMVCSDKLKNWLDHDLHFEILPDPWHKKKHNKRRLVQSEFISKLCKKLKPGAYIHLATDWQEYAQQMLEVLSSESQLQNTATSQETLLDGTVVLGYAQRPSYRPITKFENRGLKLGHGVWDLVFFKKSY